MEPTVTISLEEYNKLKLDYEQFNKWYEGERTILKHSVAFNHLGSFTEYQVIAKNDLICKLNETIGHLENTHETYKFLLLSKEKEVDKIKNHWTFFLYNLFAKK